MTVVIEHSEIRRGHYAVLEAGRLELPARSTVAVIGANGAGKSSLFLALSDVLVGRAGTLEVSAPWEAPRVALMPQESALPHWLSGERIAALYGLRLDVLAAALPELRLDEMAGLTGAQMSGGQRQALSLGLALGAQADLTILDEPLAHLDLPRRRAALRAVAGCSSGLVLVSTQSAADVVDCCDWYVVLREGRYVFSGPVEALLGDAWRSDPERQARLESHLLELIGFGSAAQTHGRTRSG
jgi:ABC-type multidrug transport system ATPase subunit